MFLYTICPGCQAGYDVTELLSGKTMRCKQCGGPFSVTGVPRPRHLPPLAPFARPHVAAPVAYAAPPQSAVTETRPLPDLTAIGRPGASYRPGPRPAQRPAPVSNAGAWLGRGGLSLAAIIVFIALRGCLAVTSRPSYTPVYTPPPQWNQNNNQWNPNNNNQWNPNGVPIKQWDENNGFQGGQNPNGDPWKGMRPKPGKKGFGDAKKDAKDDRPLIGDEQRDPKLERRRQQQPPAPTPKAPPPDGRKD
jgi:hypothetical protein